MHFCPPPPWVGSKNNVKMKGKSLFHQTIFKAVYRKLPKVKSKYIIVNKFLVIHLNQEKIPRFESINSKNLQTKKNKIYIFRLNIEVSLFCFELEILITSELVICGYYFYS